MNRDGIWNAEPPAPASAPTPKASEPSRAIEGEGGDGGSPAQAWRQERPTWCPHTDCVFRRRAMDNICGGVLPRPEPHDGDHNTHRFCLNGDLDLPGGVFDLQVNATDLDWMRWIFDALDGKETSWLSKTGSR